MALTETELSAAEGEFMREVHAYVAALLQDNEYLNNLDNPYPNPNSTKAERRVRTSLHTLVTSTFKNGPPSDKQKADLVARLLPIGPNDPIRFGRDDQPPGNR